MKIAAIYCRVSTDNQETEGTSLQTQLEACLNYCQSKDYNVAYRFSEAYSGLTLERPNLSELRELVRNEQIEVVVVYCLDRLSRDPVHGVILAQELDKHYVILEAVTETVDSSEVGKMVNYIKGFASKLEAEKIKERTMRGKKARLDQGYLPQGTGYGLFGYDWDAKAKKRVIKPRESTIAKKIFTMITEGQSCFTVASELNRAGITTKTGGQWHPLTIKRIVTNPAYYGMTIFNQTRRLNDGKRETRPEEEWITLPDITPAIISRDLFDRAQESLKQPRSRPGKALAYYLLRGHIFCPKCGSRMTGTMLNRKYRYYHCSGAKPTTLRKAICDAPYVKADWLEDTAWSTVKDTLQKPEVMIAAIKEQLESYQGKLAQEAQIDKDIALLKRKAKKHAGQQRRLVSLFRLGEFNENDILDEMNQLKEDKKADEDKLAELLATKEAILQFKLSEAKLKGFCDTLSQQIDYSDNESKRLALDALDIKVYATRSSINVQGIIPANLVTTERTWA